jgi:hypothetical protein
MCCQRPTMQARVHVYNRLTALHPSPHGAAGTKCTRRSVVATCRPDVQVAASGVVPESVPASAAVWLLMFFLAIRSRVASPFDATRPQAMTGCAAAASWLHSSLSRSSAACTQDTERTTGPSGAHSPPVRLNFFAGHLKHAQTSNACLEFTCMLVAEARGFLTV